MSRPSPPSAPPARPRWPRRGEDLPCIVGVPEAGETIGSQRFDGKTEAAVFPGDLPDDPHQALDGSLEGALRFVRFRPPVIAAPGR
jgi:uncharacterized protein